MPGKLGGTEDANQGPQFVCKSREPQTRVSAGSLTCCVSSDRSQNRSNATWQGSEGLRRDGEGQLLSQHQDIGGAHEGCVSL